MTKKTLQLAKEFIESVHEGEWCMNIERAEVLEKLEAALRKHIPELVPVATVFYPGLYANDRPIRQALWIPTTEDVPDGTTIYVIKEEK